MKKIFIILFLFGQIMSKAQSIGSLQATQNYQTYVGSYFDAHTLIDVCNYICRESYYGNFQYIDRVWDFECFKQAYSYISIANPSSTALTAVNSPTWTSASGYTFNGSTNYLNTNFNISTQNTNFTLNNACHVALINNLNGATSGRSGCFSSSGNYTIQIIDQSSVDYCYVNQSGSTSCYGTAKGLAGLYSFVRTTSTASALYYNGVSYLTSSSSYGSTAIPAYNFYVGAQNNYGSSANDFDTKQYGTELLGSANINQANEYTDQQVLTW